MSEELNNGRDCIHGQLKRSCDKCAYEAEIEGLKVAFYDRVRIIELQLRDKEELKSKLSVALDQMKLAYAWCKGTEGEDLFHADRLGEAIKQIEGNI